MDKTIVHAQTSPMKKQILIAFQWLTQGYLDQFTTLDINPLHVPACTSLSRKVYR